MRRGILVLLAAAAVSRLAAQAPALPVVNAGVPRGFTIGGMVGFANADADGGTGLGVLGSYGFRRFGIGGYVSRVGGSDFGGYNSVGGSLTAKVLGGPLVPVAVNLQAGVGYFRASALDASEEQYRRWHVPVGLGISWTIPRPVVALKPWIAPRLDYVRTSTDLPDPLADPVPGGATPLITTVDSGTEFGLSGGITFGLINGIGIDLAIDKVFAKGSSPKPTVLGVGLHYTFK